MTSTLHEINKKKTYDDIGSYLLLAVFALLFLLLSGSSPLSSDFGDATTSPQANNGFGENSSGPATTTKSNPFRLLGRNKVSSSIKKKNGSTATAEQADLASKASSSSWFGSYTSDDASKVSTYVAPTNNYYLETFVEYAEHFTEKVNETITETKKKLRERIGNIFGFFKRIVRRKPKKVAENTAATA